MNKYIGYMARLIYFIKSQILILSFSVEKLIRMKL